MLGNTIRVTFIYRNLTSRTLRLVVQNGANFLCIGKRFHIIGTADYAASATGSTGCWTQFQGMSSSHRAAGQSAAIFPVTSAM